MEIFLQLSGLFKSNSEIKRSLKENSIMINKERVNDHFDFNLAIEHNRYYIYLSVEVRVGRWVIVWVGEGGIGSGGGGTGVSPA